MSTPDLRDSVKRVNQIADGVILVSRAVKQLEAGKLNEKAILVLMASSTGLSQTMIKKVLNGLSELENTYVKP